MKLFIVFINTLIFTGLFNSLILMQRYADFKAAGGNAALYELIGETLCAVIAVFPIIYCLSWNKLIFKIILISIYIICGITSYFIYIANITVTPEIIGSFFETTRNEALSFVSLELFLWVLFSGFMGFICLKSVQFAKKNIEQDKRITFITSIFFLSCLLGDGDWMSNIMPYNILKYSGSYWLDKANVTQRRLDIAKEFQYKLEGQDDDLNIVLIIGESARSDHFSLSGYERNTNPLLSLEKNLIYYKDVTACYPATRAAVPCMITRATRDNRLISHNETSFVGIFRKLGFYTGWLSMQGTYTAIDSPYTDLAKEANKTILVGNDVGMFTSNDSALFPFIDKFLQDQKQGRNFLVLHTIGNHFHYEERYTDEFRKFTPICRKKNLVSSMTHCTKEETINSYDNSILFTDYFIKNVIDRFRDKKALVIFTPDHGESLGEGGRFLHGTHNADEQIAVNMIIWASDKYIKAYPKNIAQLRKTKEILHDHLFHSILGCSGIKSDIIKAELNLCGAR